MEPVVISLLLVIISWFISQYAKNIIPRLLFSTLGLYFILISPINSFYSLVGIGFILAHILTIPKYLLIQFLILKQATIDSYYFSLTIYARFLILCKWIKSFFKSFIILISTFNFGQAKNNYEKENPNDDFQNKYERYYKQEKFYNHSNDYNEKETSHTEVQKSNNPTGKDEFDKYFSDSKYEILDVTVNTPYKEINKQYKSLAKMFHPDLGTVKEETGLVMKNINLAFECFKSKNKKSTTHVCKFC